MFHNNFNCVKVLQMPWGVDSVVVSKTLNLIKLNGESQLNVRKPNAVPMPNANIICTALGF